MMQQSFRDQGIQLLHETRRVGATIHLLRNWKPIDDLIYGEKRLASPVDAYVVLSHVGFGEMKVAMTLEGRFLIAKRVVYAFALADGTPAEKPPAEKPRVIGAKELCKRFSLRTMLQAITRTETIVSEHVYGMRHALELAAELNGVETPAEAA
jgi:hypothetical protein